MLCSTYKFILWSVIFKRIKKQKKNIGDISSTGLTCLGWTSSHAKCANSLVYYRHCSSVRGDLHGFNTLFDNPCWCHYFFSLSSDSTWFMITYLHDHQFLFLWSWWQPWRICDRNVTCHFCIAVFLSWFSGWEVAVWVNSVHVLRCFKW